MNVNLSYFSKFRNSMVCVLLTLVTLALYSPVANYDFINYDDIAYVYENQQVISGLTEKGLIWAFTTHHAANWHPLTWISHMLDCDLYGLNPGLHHLTNVWFHIANTLLLFLILMQMTGNAWQSVMVAALFALHPLHVESVAWVAERKDVLSTFFWMLTMHSYFRFVKRPGAGRYCLVAGLFALGLMAKPMLVTLPFVLLLLDYWPLNRLKPMSASAQPPATVHSFTHLAVEKVPLIAMAILSGIITYRVQQSAGAVDLLGAYPLDIRLANATVSYGMYLFKMIWPFNLAVFYPHPGMPPTWKFAISLIVCIGISLVAFRKARQYPYLIVGWLWYLGTLVPVIGLVQVGNQSMADRYTYIPLIGIFITLVWGVSEIAARYKITYGWSAASAVIILSILSTFTWHQLRYWKDSITLFSRTLEITENNWPMHNNLAIAYGRNGEDENAIIHFQKTIRLNPVYISAHNNLGYALDRVDRVDKALEHYLIALLLDPDSEKTIRILGAFLNTLRHQNTITSIGIGSALDLADAHYKIAIMLDQEGRIERAIKHYRAAFSGKSKDAEIHFKLGNAHSKKGNIEDSRKSFLAAIGIKPDYARAHNNLGIILMRQGDVSGAMEHFRDAIKYNPEYALAKKNLKNAVKLFNDSKKIP